MGNAKLPGPGVTGGELGSTTAHASLRQAEATDRVCRLSRSPMRADSATQALASAAKIDGMNEKKKKVNNSLHYISSIVWERGFRFIVDIRSFVL